MTITHTVVFTLVHPSGSDAEHDFLATATRMLTEIAVVDDFTVSRQVSPKSDMVWQFSMRFDTQAVYDEYNCHPSHVKFVAERWEDEVRGFQEYDFIRV